MSIEPTPPARGGFLPASTRAMPWLLMFRGPGVAFDGRKLILGALGLLLTSLGARGLDRVFGVRDASPRWPGARIVGSAAPIWPESVGTLARAVADPVVRLASPFGRMFDPAADAPGGFHAFLLAVWVVLVWGVLGGAIARIAVVELASGERPGVAAALRFALGRIGALVGAPLSPLIGLSVLGGLCALVGLLYRLGPTGETIAGALAFLPLLAGLLMALLLAGLGLGWPLMVLTVAAQGEDVFDALSRSYSYVFQRPWRYLGLVTLAWAIGALGLIAAWVLANLVVQMALWGLTAGGPDTRVIRLFEPSAGGDAGMAGTLHAFWLAVVDLLASGWIYAYFWSASAIVYLLIRRDVDGTEIEDVYQPAPGRDRIAPGPTASTPVEPPERPGHEGEGPP
jgi:hypothetical protein